MAVQMALSRISIRDMTDMQFIELTELDGTRSFPIVIGLHEAYAINRRLSGVKIPRPQTHDLLASVIRHLGGTLRQIVIHDLESGTFYAKLVIEQDGVPIEVDSRPSDAIALGVAEDVPIFVAEHVLEQASAEQDAGGEPDSDEDAESEGDW
ncbi:MAG: bifunctional nuclease family protein [Phycisphaerales bacterium]|nr:bifunctional nuclease family protein [Phycisphaerales bacterium]